MSIKIPVSNNFVKLEEDKFIKVKEIGVHTGTHFFGLPHNDIDFVLTAKEANENNIIDQEDYQRCFFINYLILK